MPSRRLSSWTLRCSACPGLRRPLLRLIRSTSPIFVGERCIKFLASEKFDAWTAPRSAAGLIVANHLIGPSTALMRRKRHHSALRIRSRAPVLVAASLGQPLSFCAWCTTTPTAPMYCHRAPQAPMYCHCAPRNCQISPY